LLNIQCKNIKKVSPELIQFIIQEIERLDYGKVIIEIGTRNKVDIITETRKRFEKKDE